MGKVFVVVATYELGATAYGSDIIGVFNRPNKAFEAIEKYDKVGFFKEELIGFNGTVRRVVRDIGLRDGCASYSELWYTNTDSDNDPCGSIELSITEKEVV